MKITVLAENTTCNENLGFEHGLCLFVQTGNHTFLFDTGRSPLFAENAEKLGIDISKVEFVVLSHGHYDHGGGLERFFEINKFAPVYVNKFAFEPHWHKKDDYIGLDVKLLKNKERFIFADDYLKIDDNLEIYNTNMRSPKYPINPYGLHTQTNGLFTDEDFRHEQYLLMDKKILLSGCSHKGILNIEEWFKPNVLIGGFHFMELDASNTDDKSELKKQASELLSFNTTFYTCHCTGVENYKFLKSIMGDKLNYISTGTTFFVG